MGIVIRKNQKKIINEKTNSDDRMKINSDERIIPRSTELPENHIEIGNWFILDTITHYIGWNGKFYELSNMAGVGLPTGNNDDLFGGSGGSRDPSDPFSWEGFDECFVAGTKILLSDNSNKNIEDVQVGDYVKSFNVKTNQFENKLVTKLYTQTHNLKDGDITVKITFTNGIITHNTIANPFWSEEKGFIAVDEERCNRLHQWVIDSNGGDNIQSLDIGDTLHYYDDSDDTLKEVIVENIEYILEKDIRTYDITVEDNHTFFANGILTHNSGNGDTSTGTGYWWYCQPGMTGVGSGQQWPQCACWDSEGGTIPYEAGNPGDYVSGYSYNQPPGPYSCRRYNQIADQYPDGTMWWGPGGPFAMNGFDIQGGWHHLYEDYVSPDGTWSVNQLGYNNFIGFSQNWASPAEGCMACSQCFWNFTTNVCCDLSDIECQNCNSWDRVNEECLYGGETNEGCTDPDSNNYNPNASIDDGTCQYLDECYNLVQPELGIQSTLASCMTLSENNCGYNPVTGENYVYCPTYNSSNLPEAPPNPFPSENCPIFDCAGDCDGPSVEAMCGELIGGFINDNETSWVDDDFQDWMFDDIVKYAFLSPNGEGGWTPHNWMCGGELAESPGQLKSNVCINPTEIDLEGVTDGTAISYIQQYCTYIPAGFCDCTGTVPEDCGGTCPSHGDLIGSDGSCDEDGNCDEGGATWSTLPHWIYFGHKHDDCGECKSLIPIDDPDTHPTNFLYGDIPFMYHWGYGDYNFNTMTIFGNELPGFSAGSSHNQFGIDIPTVTSQNLSAYSSWDIHDKMKHEVGSRWGSPCKCGYDPNFPETIGQYTLNICGICGEEPFGKDGLWKAEMPISCWDNPDYAPNIGVCGDRGFKWKGLGMPDDYAINLPPELYNLFDAGVGSAPMDAYSTFSLPFKHPEFAVEADAGGFPSFNDTPYCDLYSCIFTEHFQGPTTMAELAPGGLIGWDISSANPPFPNTKSFSAPILHGTIIQKVINNFDMFEAENDYYSTILPPTGAVGDPNSYLWFVNGDIFFENYAFYHYELGWLKYPLQENPYDSVQFTDEDTFTTNDVFRVSLAGHTHHYENDLISAEATGVEEGDTFLELYDLPLSNYTHPTGQESNDGIPQFLLGTMFDPNSIYGDINSTTSIYNQSININTLPATEYNNITLGNDSFDNPWPRFNSKVVYIDQTNLEEYSTGFGELPNNKYLLSTDLNQYPLSNYPQQNIDLFNRYIGPDGLPLSRFSSAFFNEYESTVYNRGAFPSQPHRNLWLGCPPEIQGCMDSYACNYNADANQDDGTCEYEQCRSCTDNIGEDNPRKSGGACNLGYTPFYEYLIDTDLPESMIQGQLYRECIQNGGTDYCITDNSICEYPYYYSADNDQDGVPDVASLPYTWPYNEYWNWLDNPEWETYTYSTYTGPSNGEFLEGSAIFACLDGLPGYNPTNLGSVIDTLVLGQNTLSGMGIFGICDSAIESDELEVPVTSYGWEDANIIGGQACAKITAPGHPIGYDENPDDAENTGILPFYNLSYEEWQYLTNYGLIDLDSDNPLSPGILPYENLFEVNEDELTDIIVYDFDTLPSILNETLTIYITSEPTFGSLYNTNNQLLQVPTENTLIDVVYNPCNEGDYFSYELNDCVRANSDIVWYYDTARQACDTLITSVYPEVDVLAVLVSDGNWNTQVYQNGPKHCEMAPDDPWRSPAFGGSNCPNSFKPNMYSVFGLQDFMFSGPRQYHCWNDPIEECVGDYCLPDSTCNGQEFSLDSMGNYKNPCCSLHRTGFNLMTDFCIPSNDIWPDLLDEFTPGGCCNFLTSPGYPEYELNQCNDTKSGLANNDYMVEATRHPNFNWNTGEIPPEILNQFGLSSNYQYIPTDMIDVFENVTAVCSTRTIGEIDGNTVRYQSAENFFSTQDDYTTYDTFRYIICDSTFNGSTNQDEACSAEFEHTIKINPINDVPIITDKEYTTFEDHAISIEIVEGFNFDEIDLNDDIMTGPSHDGPFTISITSQPQDGEALIDADNTMVINYTPPSDYSNLFQTYNQVIGYTVTDDNGGISAEGYLNIKVLPIVDIQIQDMEIQATEDVIKEIIVDCQFDDNAIPVADVFTWANLQEPSYVPSGDQVPLDQWLTIPLGLAVQTGFKIGVEFNCDGSADTHSNSCLPLSNGSANIEDTTDIQQIIDTYNEYLNSGLDTLLSPTNYFRVKLTPSPNWHGEINVPYRCYVERPEYYNFSDNGEEYDWEDYQYGTHESFLGYDFQGSLTNYSQWANLRFSVSEVSDGPIVMPIQLNKYNNAFFENYLRNHDLPSIHNNNLYCNDSVLDLENYSQDGQPYEDISFTWYGDDASTMSGFEASYSTWEVMHSCPQSMMLRSSVYLAWLNSLQSVGKAAFRNLVFGDDANIHNVTDGGIAFPLPPNQLFEWPSSDYNNVDFDSPGGFTPPAKIDYMTDVCQWMTFSNQNGHLNNLGYYYYNEIDNLYSDSVCDFARYLLETPTGLYGPGGNTRMGGIYDHLDAYWPGTDVLPEEIYREDTAPAETYGRDLMSIHVDAWAPYGFGKYPFTRNNSGVGQSSHQVSNSEFSNYDELAGVGINGYAFPRFGSVNGWAPKTAIAPSDFISKVDFERVQMSGAQIDFDSLAKGFSFVDIGPFEFPFDTEYQEIVGVSDKLKARLGNSGGGPGSIEFGSINKLSGKGGLGLLGDVSDTNNVVINGVEHPQGTYSRLALAEYQMARYTHFKKHQQFAFGGTQPSVHHDNDSNVYGSVHDSPKDPSSMSWLTKAPFFEPVKDGTGVQSSKLTVKEDSESYFVVRAFNPQNYDTTLQNITANITLSNGRDGAGDMDAVSINFVNIDSDTGEEINGGEGFIYTLDESAPDRYDVNTKAIDYFSDDFELIKWFYPLEAKNLNYSQHMDVLSGFSQTSDYIFTPHAQNHSEDGSGNTIIENSIGTNRHTKFVAIQPSWGTPSYMTGDEYSKTISGNKRNFNLKCNPRKIPKKKSPYYTPDVNSDLHGDYRNVYLWPYLQTSDGYENIESENVIGYPASKLYNEDVYLRSDYPTSLVEEDLLEETHPGLFNFCYNHNYNESQETGPINNNIKEFVFKINLTENYFNKSLDWGYATQSQLIDLPVTVKITLTNEDCVVDTTPENSTCTTDIEFDLSVTSVNDKLTMEILNDNDASFPTAIYRYYHNTPSVVPAIYQTVEPSVGGDDMINSNNYINLYNYSTIGQDENHISSYEDMPAEVYDSTDGGYIPIPNAHTEQFTNEDILDNNSYFNPSVPEQFLGYLGTTSWNADEPNMDYSSNYIPIYFKIRDNDIENSFGIDGKYLCSEFGYQTPYIIPTYFLNNLLYDIGDPTESSYEYYIQQLLDEVKNPCIAINTTSDTDFWGRIPAGGSGGDDETWLPGPPAFLYNLELISQQSISNNYSGFEYLFKLYVFPHKKSNILKGQRFEILALEGQSPLPIYNAEDDFTEGLGEYSTSVRCTWDTFKYYTEDSAGDNLLPESTSPAMSNWIPHNDHGFGRLSGNNYHQIYAIKEEYSNTGKTQQRLCEDSLLGYVEANQADLGYPYTLMLESALTSGLEDSEIGPGGEVYTPLGLYGTRKYRPIHQSFSNTTAAQDLTVGYSTKQIEYFSQHEKHGLNEIKGCQHPLGANWGITQPYESNQGFSATGWTDWDEFNYTEITPQINWDENSSLSITQPMSDTACASAIIDNLNPHAFSSKFQLDFYLNPDNFIQLGGGAYDLQYGISDDTGTNDLDNTFISTVMGTRATINDITPEENNRINKEFELKLPSFSGEFITNPVLSTNILEHWDTNPRFDFYNMNTLVDTTLYIKGNCSDLSDGVKAERLTLTINNYNPIWEMGSYINTYYEYFAHNSSYDTLEVCNDICSVECNPTVTHNNYLLKDNGVFRQDISVLNYFGRPSTNSGRLKTLWTCPNDTGLLLDNEFVGTEDFDGRGGAYTFKIPYKMFKEGNTEFIINFKNSGNCNEDIRSCSGTNENCDKKVFIDKIGFKLPGIVDEEKFIYPKCGIGSTEFCEGEIYDNVVKELIDINTQVNNSLGCYKKYFYDGQQRGPKNYFTYNSDYTGEDFPTYQSTACRTGFDSDGDGDSNEWGCECHCLDVNTAVNNGHTSKTIYPYFKYSDIDNQFVTNPIDIGVILAAGNAGSCTGTVDSYNSVCIDNCQTLCKPETFINETSEIFNKYIVTENMCNSSFAEYDIHNYVTSTSWPFLGGFYFNNGGLWSDLTSIIHPSQNTGISDNDDADTTPFAMMNQNSSMIFKIPKQWWGDNGFHFANLTQEVELQDAPQYGQIYQGRSADNLFTTDTLPDFHSTPYMKSYDSVSPNDNWFTYSLNNITHPEQAYYNSDEIYNVWDYFCNPFNDIIYDSFNLRLNLILEYNGITVDTRAISMSEKVRGVRTILKNDNVGYECNNFDILGEQRQDIVVKENFVDVNLNFDLLSTNQCSDGSECNPIAVYNSEIFPFDSTNVGVENIYSFEWPYQEASECQIELTIDDIDSYVNQEGFVSRLMFSTDGDSYVDYGSLGKWHNSEVDIENVGEDILANYNGQFLTDVDFSSTCPNSTCWYPNSNWTIQNNTAIADGSSGDNINHSFLTGVGSGIKAETTYIVKIEILEISQGGVRVQLGDTNGLTYSSSGIYIEEITTSTEEEIDGTGNALKIYPSQNGICTINSIEIREKPIDSEGGGGLRTVYKTGFASGLTVDGNTAYLDKVVCTPGTNYFYIDDGTENTDDFSLKNFKVTKHSNICNDGGLCGLEESDVNPLYYQTRGYGIVKDTSVNYLAYGDDLDLCVAIGHCYINGTSVTGELFTDDRQYGLTEQGLKTYDYSIGFDFSSSEGIGGKGERFSNLVLNGSLPELTSMLNRFNQDSESYFRINGYRKIDWTADNQCCTQDEINQGDNVVCAQNMRTLFKVEPGNFQYDSYNSSNILAGEIYNTPYRFCAGDRLYVDAQAGFGSETYSSIVVVETGNCEFTGDICIPNAGEQCGGDDDNPIYCEPTIQYEELDIGYTGYESEVAETTITPLDIGEGDVPIFTLFVKRSFGYAQGLVNAPIEKEIDLNVLVVGMNTPHIHYIKYIDETSKQIGIANSSLKIYDNVGSNLLSSEYLNVEENKDINFGVKSIGKIDFSTYEPKLDENNDMVQVPNSKILLNGIDISNSFNGNSTVDPQTNTISYIWDNIINAINNHPSKYTAYFSEDSNTNPSSNIKTVIIEALEVGKEFNGTLTWTIEDNYLKAQPIITDLINGESYPILNLFEDFGSFDLLIAASDRDKLSTLNILTGISDVDGYNQPLINFQILDNSQYQTLDGIPNNSDFSWGDLFNYSQQNFYYYPFGGFVDYSQIDLSGDIPGQPQLTYPELDDYGNSYTTTNFQPHSNLSHVNQIVRCTLSNSAKNYNGSVDLNVRVVDEDGTEDKVFFRIVIHPVNDPPIVETISDVEMYINNFIYPNDINVKIETKDIEEGKENLSLVALDEITNEYCDKIEDVYNYISNFTSPIQYKGNVVVPNYNFIKSQKYDEYQTSGGLDSWKNQFSNHNYPTSTATYGIDDPNGGTNAVRINFDNVNATAYPQSLLRYFSPTNLIDGQTYYYTGCVRLIQYGYVWDDTATYADKTIRFDVNDNNSSYVSIQSNQNEWYCFEESFVWDETLTPDVLTDLEFRLDLTPAGEQFVNHIVDLYNIKVITDVEIQPCTNVRYCSTVCHEKFGIGEKQAEKLCSFANYDFDGGRLPYELNEMGELLLNTDYTKNLEITQSDINLCRSDVDEGVEGSNDLSFVGGHLTKCNSKKYLIDLIYDMYYSYGINFTGDAVCGDELNSIGLLSSTDATFVDSVTGCLTTNACISYLENNVGIINIPTGYILDSDNNIIASNDESDGTYEPFTNTLDSATDLCNQMDYDGDGIINKLDVKNIKNDNILKNKNIYTCNSGPSVGKLCEEILQVVVGTCSLSPYQMSCNYYLDDCPDEVGTCIPNTSLFNTYGTVNDELCEQYPAPNFLTFENYSELYNDFKRDTGYENLDTYFHFEPTHNSIGTKSIRVGLQDTGLDENDNFSQAKTGYSKVKIYVNEGSSTGPTGTISSQEIASFGFIADSYKHTIGGTDARQTVPTKLSKDYDIKVYDYHPVGTEIDFCDGDDTLIEKEECEFAGFNWVKGNKVSDDCGLYQGENPGFYNSDGECCSSIPVNSDLIRDHSRYYNTDKKHFYKQEWEDELQLYINYYSGKNSKYCTATYETTWEYSEYFDNNNVGGFEPPNVSINPLDFTVSYKFSIIDVVEDYDNINEQRDRDWWIELGLDDYANDDEWSESWNRLRREGWLDLFGPRVEGHPLGDTSIDTTGDGIPDGFVVLEGDLLEQTIPKPEGWEEEFTSLSYVGSTSFADTVLIQPTDNTSGLNYNIIDEEGFAYIRYILPTGYFTNVVEPEIGYCENSTQCSDINTEGLEFFGTNYEGFLYQVRSRCVEGGTYQFAYDATIKSNCKWYYSGIPQSSYRGCNCYNNTTLDRIYDPPDCAEPDNQLGDVNNPDGFDEGNIPEDASYPYGLYNSVGESNICGDETADIENCFKTYPDSIVNPNLEPDYLEYYNRCAGCASQSYRNPCYEDTDCLNDGGNYDGSVCVGGVVGDTGVWTEPTVDDDDFFTQINDYHDFTDYSLLSPHIPGYATNFYLKVGNELEFEWIKIVSHKKVETDGMTYARFKLERGQFSTNIKQDFNLTDTVEIYVVDEEEVDTWENTSFSKILDEGYEYQFSWPSIYGIRVEAVDTYGNKSTETKYIDARNILLLEQSVQFKYDPWQGINVVMDEDVKNQSWMINLYDKDKRPALGCWFYDDLIGNKTDDWNIRHGDSYKDVEGGNFIENYDGNVSSDTTNWTPDAYVFTPTSIGSSNAVLTKYYDNKLQPLAYEETSAPLEARVYFYTREDDNSSDNIFENREIIKTGPSNISSNDFYIGFLNWGDGSPIEYDKEPFYLSSGNKFLSHLYKKSGIYHITCDMFNVYRNAQEEVQGIISFKEIKLTINVNKNLELEGEFASLGGSGYDFIPYNKTHPVVGGISKYSLYYKILLNINGILNPVDLQKLIDLVGDLDEGMEDLTSVDIPYKYYGEKYNSELAIVNTNEDLLKDLKIIPHFTGSFANQSLNIADDSEVIIDIVDDACTYGDDYIDDISGLEGRGFKCELENSPANGLYFMIESYVDFTDIDGVGSPFRSAFLDCEDECNIFERAENVKGFFEGVVDNNGELLGDDDNGNQITPRLINRGIDVFPGELGDHLGNVDLGQLRYFNKPFQMWEMLGFQAPNDLDFTVGLGDELISSTTTFDENVPAEYDGGTNGWRTRNSSYIEDGIAHVLFTHPSNQLGNCYCPLPDGCTEGVCEDGSSCTRNSDCSNGDCDHTGANCSGWNHGNSGCTADGLNCYLLCFRDGYDLDNDYPQGNYEQCNETYTGISGCEWTSTNNSGVGMSPYNWSLYHDNVFTEIGGTYKIEVRARRASGSPDASWKMQVRNSYYAIPFEGSGCGPGTDVQCSSDGTDVLLTDQFQTFTYTYVQGDPLNCHNCANVLTSWANDKLIIGAYNTSSDSENDYYPEIEVEYVSVRQVIETESVEFQTSEEAVRARSLLHPGSPLSPRYWKNIVSERELFYREGLGTLPILPNNTFVDDSDNYIGRPFEVIFGWGNLVREEIEISDTVYNEYIEILYSLSAGDDIEEIQFIFNDIELPFLQDEMDSNLGGVTLPNNQGGFNFAITTNNNSLILKPHPDFIQTDPRISAAGITEDIFNLIDCGGEGITGGNCDGFISEYEIDLYNQDTSNSLSGIQFIDFDSDNDGLINKTEAQSNIQTDLLVRIPILNKGNEIGFNQIIVKKADDEIVTDFWWNIYDSPFVVPNYTGYSGVIINTNTTQNYLSLNEYGNNYYYPVLPKIKVNGYFDEQSEDSSWSDNLGLLGENYIPFGTTDRRWNQDDMKAPITSKLTDGKFLNHNLIDLDFSAIENDTLNDIGANTNLGILIDDYDINFTENPIELFPEKPTIRTKVDKKQKRKAY